MQQNIKGKGFLIEVEYYEKDIYPAAYIKSFALAKEFKCKFDKGFFKTSKFFFHYDIETMDLQTVDTFADNMRLFKEVLKSDETLIIGKHNFHIYVGVDKNRAMIYYHVTYDKNDAIRKYIPYLWKQISEVFQGRKGQIITKIKYNAENMEKKCLKLEFDLQGENNKKVYKEVEKLISKYDCVI